MPASPPARRWIWLGRVPFGRVAAAQERIRQQILAGAAPETLLLLEHDPVITLGRGALAQNVLAGAGELQRRGIEIHRATRGGDVTYHGPGQLVGYPIVRLDRGVLGHVRAMAEGLITVLSGLGIAARFRREAPGLWVRAPSAQGEGDADAEADADGDGEGSLREEKICSFGVHVHRRVAIHGFALNVAADVRGFDCIVPCGLSGVAVTSIARLTGGRAPPLPVLAGEVAAAFDRSFGASFARAERSEIEI